MTNAETPKSRRSIRCWLGGHRWERREHGWKCWGCGKTLTSTTSSSFSIKDVAPSASYVGWVYGSNGVAIRGATINLYAPGTLTPALMTTVSDASGYWTFNTTGEFDVEIIVGTMISRRKYGGV